MDKAELVEKLRCYDAAEVYSLLSQMVGTLIGTSILDPMEFDPTKPYHQLDNVWIPTKPIPNEEAVHFGPAAHPAFGVIPEAWRQQRQLVQDIAGIIDRRSEHITIVTNHSNVIDIVFVLGGLRLAIEDWFDPIQFSYQSAIVVSRGIAAVKFMDISAIDILRLFTNVLMSFPSTPTRQKVGFDENLVTISNELTRLELQSQRACGGHVLAVAASASRDFKLENTMYMQPVKNGTMDMVQGLVIPVAAVLDCEQPGCTILPQRQITNRQHCHELMEEIAVECGRLSGVSYEYVRSPAEYERIAYRLT